MQPLSMSISPPAVLRADAPPFVPAGGVERNDGVGAGPSRWTPPRYVAFDLETQTLVQGGAPPPNIVCASLVDVDTLLPRSIVAATPSSASPQATHQHAEPARSPSLSRSEVTRFIALLWGYVARGYTIITWGGTASDWRFLAAHCDQAAATLQRLAIMALRHHVDIPLSMLCMHGTMMSLERAALALFHVNPKAYASRAMPMLWANPATRSLVVRHCETDALYTLHVALAFTSTGCASWCTLPKPQRPWRRMSLPIPLVTASDARGSTAVLAPVASVLFMPCLRRGAAAVRGLRHMQAQHTRGFHVEWLLALRDSVCGGEPEGDARKQESREK